jgi:hypothetical protein
MFRRIILAITSFAALSVAVLAMPNTAVAQYGYDDGYRSYKYKDFYDYGFGLPRTGFYYRGAPYYRGYGPPYYPGYGPPYYPGYGPPYYPGYGPPYVQW